MYLLRWRFDWKDRTKCGLWSHPGNLDCDKAWTQNKEGLLYARIEGKNIQTRITSVLAECSGADYMNFQWLAHAITGPMGVRGSVTPLTRLVGLKMITRHEAVEIYATGEVRRGPHNHAQTKFATFGK